MSAKERKPEDLSRSEFRWPFGKRNYIFSALALAVIIVGYILLGQGSVTFAPLLLVIGYCVLVPIALIVKDPDKQKEVSKEQSPSRQA